MTRTHASRALLGIIALASAALAVSGSSLGATKKPTIHNFEPRLGPVGTVLRITGSNYTGATAVKVAGIKASFTVVSASKITATVPSIAKAGKVSIVTAGGTATSTGAFTPVAANGSDALTTTVTTVNAGATGQSVAFTYTAATNGIDGGAVTIAVPSGWTAPVTTAAVGCTSATTGTVSTSGQTITVTGLTLAAGATVTITYGATSGGSCATGDGATASTTSGAASFQADERSLASGRLTALAASPSITVNASFAANGSGTLTTPVSSVGPGENGDVIVLTYTAASGGTSGGTVSITVPTGWSPPVTSNTAGCTTTSAGTLATSGQTISVSGLTLASSATVTITYGAVSGGACTLNDGATTTTTAGSDTFSASEASTTSGTLAALASSPSITVT